MATPDGKKRLHRADGRSRGHLKGVPKPSAKDDSAKVEEEEDEDEEEVKAVGDAKKEEKPRASCRGFLPMKPAGQKRPKIDDDDEWVVDPKTGRKTLRKKKKKTTQDDSRAMPPPPSTGNAGG